MTNRNPAFFGYGSLVNRATHGYAKSAPSRLAGWRRIWRHTTLRPHPFLSVEPAAAEIDGLVAAVPSGDWTTLDAREAAYRRHAIDAGHLSPAPAWAGPVEIYAVDEVHAAAMPGGPILLSYLDTVVQGFLAEFGEPGVARFFDTTAGWTALLDDRDRPLYPRARHTSAAERALVDGHAEALGLERLPRIRHLGRKDFGGGLS